jgi:DNA-binding CsgD family transcriptional regulator
MAAYTRIASAIALDAQAKGELERLTRAPSTPQAKALRARIVLAAAQGLSNQQIAAKFHVSVNTVGKLADSIRGVSVGRAQGRPNTVARASMVPGCGKSCIAYCFGYNQVGENAGPWTAWRANSICRAAACMNCCSRLAPKADAYRRGVSRDLENLTFPLSAWACE